MNLGLSLHFCGKYFLTMVVLLLDTLQTHSMYEDGSISAVVCPHCNMDIGSESCFYNHVFFNVENGHLTYTCLICDLTTPERYQMVQHLSTHTEKMQHECNYCGEQFPSSDSVQDHIWETHMGEYGEHLTLPPMICEILI